MSSRLASKPFRNIREAAQHHKVDVTGLSFRGYFKFDDTVVLVCDIRQILDAAAEIWVGGAAFNQAADLPEGIDLIDGLHRVEHALVCWYGRMSKPANFDTGLNGEESNLHFHLLFRGLWLDSKVICVCLRIGSPRHLCLW
ncbi:MAG: hypothetical protein AB2598_09155 [Candidatus Thiodiazotropha sp.]